MSDNVQSIGSGGWVALGIGNVSGTARKLAVASLEPATFYTVTAVAVTSIGLGYTNGDVLSVYGGQGLVATLTVSSVNGTGGITGLGVTTAGKYISTPQAVGNTPTGGTGSGAVVTLTIVKNSGNNVQIAEDNAGAHIQDTLTPGDSVIRSPAAAVLYAKASARSVDVRVTAGDA